MKKLLWIVLLVVSIGAIAVACGVRERSAENGADAYLRVHIRADSNESAAQAVKYKVRDAVVEFLTPTVADCATKGAAMEKIEQQLAEIEKVAERVLRENGFSYGARASLRREEFPTRIYSDTTLEAGEYDALILELGSGKGDNWWCVVYPPLCFTSGGGNVIYKSKIAEIIKKFFG